MSDQTPSEARLRRMLPSIIVSWLFILLAVGVFVAKRPHREWHWWLFLWGIGIGVLAIVMIETQPRYVKKLLGDDAPDVAALRNRVALNRRISLVGAGVLGVVFGTISATTGWVLINVLFTAMLAIAWIGGWVAGIAVVRRHRPKPGDTTGHA